MKSELSDGECEVYKGGRGTFGSDDTGIGHD